ncbi:MAG: flippase-like domain-containing protein [Magnetococcales bacterium]|nr:flippase-like domain-containing protein [Magnetococcales bacterium]
MSDIISVAPPAQDSNKTKKWLKFFASFALGITLLIIIFKSLGITPTIAKDTLLDVGYFYFLLVVASYVVLNYTVALKWRVIITSLAPEIVPRTGYFMYFGSLSFLLNSLLPQSGFGVRVLSLKLLYNIPTTKGILTQFIDQLSELIVAAVFFLPFLFYILKIITLYQAAGALLLSIVAVFILIKFLNIKRLEGLGGWIIKRSSGLNRFSLFTKFRNLFVDVPFAKLNTSWIISIAFIKMFVSVSGTILMMWSAGITLSPLEILIIAPPVYLIGLFAITPGGLGTVDAGWLGILLLMGVDKLAIGKYLVVEIAVGNLSQALVTFFAYLVYTVINRPKAD